MAQHSIGRFEFVSLYGPGDRGEPPQLTREEILPIQRPGVDGTAFVRLGRKAPPQQLKSCIDCVNLGHVTAMQEAYRSAITDQAQNIVWNGIDYGSVFGVLYVVLDVQTLLVRRLAAAAGGLSNPSNFWLESIWVVNPVPAET